MSELPQGWDCVNFGEMLQVQYGVGLPDRMRDNSGSIPVFGSAGVSGRHSSALVDESAIVIGRKGNVGAVHLTDGPSWPIDTTYFVRPPDGISARFLLYQLLSMQLGKLDSSTAVPSLRRSDLEAQMLVVAPTAEQERIVAAIEEQFSRLDAGVAALERVQQNLKRMRAAVLQRAVTGQLFAGSHAANDSSLDLPPGWNWQPLAKIITRLRNGIFVSRPVVDAIGPAILRISAVRPLSLDTRDVRYVPDPNMLDRIEDFTLTDGDLLFTRYSGNPEYVGACAMVPTGAPRLLYPDKLIRVQVDRSLALPRFVEIAASAGRSRQEIRRRAKTTAGQTGISGGDLRTVPFPVPPLDVQEVIVSEVDRLLSCIAALEGEVRRILHRSTLLRSSILIAAFSGALVPQDPVDEPASVLLQRISAERASSNGRKPRAGRAKQGVLL